jgi:biopolymer transport protein ExbD
MARRHGSPEDTEINITPMLDIVFIMLIFFIVTTSFTRATGATIVKPEAEQAIELAGGTILIGIRPDDEIWMANRRIVADQGSRIGTVTRVMDQVRLAGVKGVAIAAEPPAGPGP